LFAKNISKMLAASLQNNRPIAKIDQLSFFA